MERESWIEVYLQVVEARRRLFAWREAGGEQHGGLAAQEMGRELHAVLRPLWDVRLTPQLDDALTEAVAVLRDFDNAASAKPRELTRLCQELAFRLDVLRMQLVLKKSGEELPVSS